MQQFLIEKLLEFLQICTENILKININIKEFIYVFANVNKILNRFIQT